jgi:hypothetical protein
LHQQKNQQTGEESLDGVAKHKASWFTALNRQATSKTEASLASGLWLGASGMPCFRAI